MVRAGGRTRCQGECARGAADQAGGEGEGAHCSHQVSGTTSWELASWEQASKVLLLKS